MSKIIKNVILNGYEYKVYDNGTIVATGELQDEKAKRNEYNQIKAGGDSRLETDHGGHLVAASHNGSPDKLNITAQDAKVNTRDIRAVERSETNALKSGDVIMTERIAHCYSDPNRPDAYMINDKVIGNDGKMRIVSSSFTNADMRQYENDYDNEVDIADDSYAAVSDKGISKEELYKALDDNNYPNDYDHSWTGKKMDNISYSNSDDEILVQNNDLTHSKTENNELSDVGDDEILAQNNDLTYNKAENDELSNAGDDAILDQNNDLVSDKNTYNPSKLNESIDSQNNDKNPSYVESKSKSNDYGIE